MLTRWNEENNNRFNRDRRQNTTLKQTSTPTLTIVSSTEMKNYLKVDSTDDDDLINVITLASQKAIETQLGGTPIIECDFEQRQRGGCKNIKLLRQPVNGIPTVSYYESFNTVTASNITYSTHFRNVNETLISVDGWFETGRDKDGYTIAFKAGMYDSSNYDSADEGLKMAVKRISGYLYENREEGAIDVSEANWKVKYSWEDDPMGVKYLLMPFNEGYGIM